jgi:hypothetical protein
MFPSKGEHILIMAIGSKSSASSEQIVAPSEQIVAPSSPRKRKISWEFVQSGDVKQLSDHDFIDFFQHSPIALHFLKGARCIV